MKPKKSVSQSAKSQKSRKDGNLRAEVNLLYEIGCIRNIDRTWKQYLGPGAANLAEHHYRVLWIALVLAKRVDDVDHEKLLKLALMHDVPESRTGDAHYLTRQYVTRQEEKAAHDIFAGTPLQNEMMELFREYEKRESIESKIVKDADTLDVEFELKELESRGYSVSGIFENHRKKHVYPRMYTDAARELWAAIHDKSSHPHVWHHDSLQNRFKGGDWKKIPSKKKK